MALLALALMRVATSLATSTETYYPAAGAMRSSTLYYMLKDHLGSTGILSNSGGSVVADQRYYPFGETRIVTGTMYTDRLFTGQREMTGSGIYYYGARFYSPKLGRFLSADTIVPGYTNPQNLNRFAYTINNPVRYTDSTGHMIDDGCDVGLCGGTDDPQLPPPTGAIGTHTNTGGNMNLNPPVVDIPIIDIGPILIPIFGPDVPDWTDPRSCTELAHDYFALIGKIASTFAKIQELQKELAGTTEPERRQDILDEIKDLQEKLGELVREQDEIYNIAKKKGCNVGGWY